MNADKQVVLDTLQRFYGYRSFRPGQWEVIENALKRKDTLVLMPTGGGKSICYQLPALLLDGVTLVVSPLIALMNDQVMALSANGIPAAAIHSNQDESINRDCIETASKGKLKLLYISPERLLSDFETVKKLHVSLVAIDEAHCISQWGHDFRPVYTQLNAIKETFPEVPVMALTATADRLTRLDIGKALGLNEPFSWIGSFDRPNISLQVIADPGKKKRLEMIAALISSHPSDSGIVYCLSRKKTEDMHVALSNMGFRSACYHAGMPREEREKAQRAFTNGEVQVVCATIAFGMGIDKSNIRWVVHNNIPGNIESYYQEVGRAGRDGMPAEAILFYNYGDIITRRSFAEQSGMAEVNNEKLEFMQRYAEAPICRRRILLSYFSEETTCDCGNCDNCRNPRRRFDGTVLAQKALSAVIRINSQETLNNIIDILRGSNRQDLLAKGYDKIKTYGAGADLSSREWHNYLLQMIQLGLFEVAYEDNFHLRPTSHGLRVVKGLEKIELAEYVNVIQGKKKKVYETAVKLSPEEQLLENLKSIRKKLAEENFLAPYMVFSDAALSEMVAKKPADIDALLEVSGVGPLKAAKFGKPFLLELRKFVTGKRTLPPGYSERMTFHLFKSGMAIGDIANLREIKESTAYSHLSGCEDKGDDIDWTRLFTPIQYGVFLRYYDKENPGCFETLKEKGVPNYVVDACRRYEMKRNSQN